MKADHDPSESVGKLQSEYVKDDPDTELGIQILEISLQYPFSGSTQVAHVCLSSQLFYAAVSPYDARVTHLRLMRRRSFGCSFLSPRWWQEVAGFASARRPTAFSHQPVKTSDRACASGQRRVKRAPAEVHGALRLRSARCLHVFHRRRRTTWRPCRCL